MHFLIGSYMKNTYNTRTHLRPGQPNEYAGNKSVDPKAQEKT